MRDFREELGKHILILDGAMGTQLQKLKILKSGDCPDYLNITHSDVIEEIHRSYIEVGADIIVTNTFGANRIKLSEFNLEDKLYDINYKAVKIAKNAAKNDAFVSLSIGPTGKFVEPIGNMTFDEMKKIFKEQVKAAQDANVDLFSLETFMDIKEIKAAIVGIRELSDKPIIAMMTFAEDGRSIFGTTPEVFAITISAMDVDVIGANCSVGPDKLNTFMKKMADIVKANFIIQPNAGIPLLIDGNTVFPVDPYEFASYADDFVQYASIVAGCCGTSPEHIKLLSQKLKGKPLTERHVIKKTYLTSRSSVVTCGYGEPTVFIGEKLNPTGKKKLKEQLMESKTGLYRKEAISQVENKASILDINVGAPMIDEKMMMKKCTLAVESVVNAPLVIDSSDPDVLIEGLKAADGKVLINSVNGSQESMDMILPLAKRYGASILALLLDENGIPETAIDRLNILDRIVNTALKYNINIEDIIADPLSLTVGSDREKAFETLKTIKLIKEKYGITTVLGLSNISFGLPNRNILNATFLAMAIYNGLDCAIVNPYDPFVWYIKYGADLIANRDKNASLYIKNTSAISLSTHSNDMGSSKIVSSFPNNSLEDKLFKSIVEGSEEEAYDLTKILLESKDPLYISNNILIPALKVSGNFYEKGIYFLPQMIKSANAMKKAFLILREKISKMGVTTTDNGKTIVLATVKGDIHDIGKNIVALLLEVNGFKIVNLGKNIDTQTIIDAIERYHANAVGLSALMTTTMIYMKDVINMIRKKGLSVKVMVGGAAVTKDFANKIGADIYAKDALEAVKVALENV